MNYEIKGNDLDLSGTLRTVGADRTTGVITGLRAGTGYALKLTAQMGATSCSGSALFDVIAAQTTAVRLVVKCRDEKPRGTLTVDGHFDLCPVITAASASPVAVALGDSIQLDAQATDADGDALNYLWSASGGTLTDASAADGAFTCEQPGLHTLNVAVRDSADCSSTISIDVQCGQAPPGGADGGVAIDAGMGSTDAAVGADAGNGGADAASGVDAGVASDAGGAPDAAASGDAGSGSSAGGGASPLAGTWIAQVQTAGTIQAPVVGSVSANIVLVTRIAITESAGSLSETLEICRLQTTSTPNASSLTVSYPAAVIASLSDTRSTSGAAPSVGDAFPAPSFTILSGLDASGQPVDADHDGNPGVTLPTNIGGVLALDAYVGLNIATSFTATLTAPDTISGTTAFSVSGTVFGSSNPVLNSGSINVTPSSSAVPITARRLDGDVPCSSVVSMFQ